jgi:ribosomal protein L13
VKTYSAKPSDIDKKWWIIDAKNLILGRLASQTAILLRGKHKPTFTPHMDCGDNVIIINAEKVGLSGNKVENKKYYNNSQYVGGLRTRTAGVMLKEFPEIQIVAEASNVDEALEMIDRLKPQLLFLDINMPYMNGWDFLAELKVIVPELPKSTLIYILTSSDFNEDVEKSKTFSELSGYFVKPLAPEYFEKVFSELDKQHPGWDS